MLLAGLLAAPSYYTKKPLTNRQVRSQAHQIVRHLKKQDPRVLRSVMYYMGWVPKLKYKRERRKKQRDLDAFDQWHLDFLMNEAGIPNPRKQKRRR
jgi:Uri superfamily endonuclease